MLVKSALAYKYGMLIFLVKFPLLVYTLRIFDSPDNP